MPHHPIIRWETDGGATLSADKNSRAANGRHSETQPENVGGRRVEDSSLASGSTAPSRLASRRESLDRKAALSPQFDAVQRPN
jgi:hypothetical protein